jgi:MEDS: MEthanogen/methylotroph, DcmR Sensory domain
MADPVASSHEVRLYGDDAELFATVFSFLAEGIEGREPAVVVATPEHRHGLVAGLADRGWDAERLEAEGRLLLADADETLAAILHDGVPSPDAFDRTVGGLLDLAEASAPGLRVRVFGEMVDVLNRRGDPRGAAVLEQLWNRLLARRPVSLLCGYRVDLFDADVQASLLADVCRAHTRVEVGDDPRRFQDAVDAALSETLGRADAQKVWALVADEIRDGRVPAAQLALMWVSTYMPRSASRVLERARERYVPATG